MSLLLLLTGEAVDTLTLLPATGTPARGDSYALIATLLDDNGDPRVGVMLDFTVTGANPQTYSDDTDVLGQVTFPYVGNNSGVDTVTVEVPLPGGTLDTWATRQTLGTDHGEEGVACARGNKIHYIGGSTALRRHDLYDVDTNTWTNLADLPHDFQAGAAVSVNGKVYISGGLDGGANPLDHMLEYDPDASLGSQYTYKTALPRDRYRHGMVEIDGTIYLLAGNGATFPAETDAYDPVADSYETKDDIPTPRQFVGVAVTGGKVYVCGGADPSPTESAKVEVFDPIADSWTAKADLPTARQAPYVTAGDGYVWIVGGVVGGLTLDENERLDILANTYSDAAVLPNKERNGGYATVNGGLHVMKDTTWHYRYEAFEAVEEAESATVTWASVGSGKLGRRTARVVP